MKKLILQPEAQQINVLDRRYYADKKVDIHNPKDGDEYYPSVTTVLGVYPKTENFYQWLRETGNESHSVLRQAGMEGTLMHDAIEDIINGREFTMIDEDGKSKFPILVWEMLCRFMEFAAMVDSSISVEGKMLSTSLKVGGTGDWVCRINGEVWYIDHKSSKNKQPTWPVQTAVYKYMFEEKYGIKIDRFGILWLKAKTRGPNKKDPLKQGKGWQLLEYTEGYDDHMKAWHALRAVWDLANPNYKPRHLTMPNVLTIDIPHEELEKMFNTKM